MVYLGVKNTKLRQCLHHLLLIDVARVITVIAPVQQEPCLQATTKQSAELRSAGQRISKSFYVAMLLRFDQQELLLLSTLDFTAQSVWRCAT